jgi:outer membrane protein TolC
MRVEYRSLRLRLSHGGALASMVLAACASTPSQPPSHPATMSVPTSGTPAPDGDTAIQPMYRELIAIDLASAVRVASAQNLEIRAARERVEAARGRYESSVESIAPVVSPGVAFSHLSGVNQGVTGQLVPANFSTFGPLVMVQLLLNPGQVIYDAIAAKKRLLGTEQQEQFAVMDTLRQTARHYYDLVLAQAQVAVARQALTEANELTRLTALRLRAGTVLPADDAKARASLAEREQDLTAAINAFYQTSIALALTLHLDSTVTLIPRSSELTPVRLVADDLSIDRMLDIAVQYRPDLQSVRSFAAASGADVHSVLWGGVGPQVQAGYQFGEIRSQTPDQSFDTQEQRRANAGAGLGLNLATLGRVKSARAVEQQAKLDAERSLDTVRADVVSAQQESAAQAKLIPAAQRQLDSAVEALRLAKANFGVGNALLLDVLQSEDALNSARLRHTTAVVTYNKAQIDLLAALGQLDNESLGASLPISSTPSGSEAASLQRPN